MKRLALGAALLLAIGLDPRAQMRVVPIDDEQGHVALGLALRHLANTGIFMMATAHPDDENNGLLVLLNRMQGYRTALASATRGNGGQNEIGPELFEALGILRTEELAALHRFDGAEQYFTRAVDFGYSFSIEETFEKWGRDEITGDFVRLVRMIRPDVIVGMRPDGTGGGQHHQASALLARDAFVRAGDGAKYPEQMTDGLRPWQPRKYYFTGRVGYPGEPPLPAGARLVSVDLAELDPLLGKTSAEIGTEARSMHKCQGMAQLLSLPGPATASYQLVESTLAGGLDRDERTLFDGIDTTIPGLVRFAKEPVPALVESLATIASAVRSAQRSFDSESDRAALEPLLAGLRAVRALRRELPSMALDEDARFEIDFRLRQKEEEFQQAALLAGAVKIEALADDGIVVPGQAIKVATLVANRGTTEVAVRQVSVAGFSGDAACALRPVTAPAFRGPGGGGRQGSGQETGPAVSTLAPGGVARCEPTLTVPPDARVSEPYWHRAGEAGRYTLDADAPVGLPYRPSPFVVRVTLAFPGGEDIVRTLPVQYRYAGNIFSGEKRSEVLVVPALSVRMTPEIAIVPTASIGGSTTGAGSQTVDGERELRVTVVNDASSAAESVVRLEAPAGWIVKPPDQTVRLAREDEAQTVRFTVRPAPRTAGGEYHVKAVVSSGGRTFTRGFETIEYPHIRRQHIFEDADTTLKIIDVKTAPRLTVGYIVGVGDAVPPAIEQLGATLQFIGADELAWGDLSKYDAIVTGVRAYERRGDLRANNSRLLAYVFNGGTLVVQYNKFEFNEAQYGPYPAKVSSSRVTDEFAPVSVLAPNDPVLVFPNRIGETAWKNWVQERGLYFLGEKDARYRDLLRMADPFPYNAGPRLGSLVEAEYGRGHWVYVGLGLWRQLPAGTDGAYQILANLISLGKAGAAPSGAVRRNP